MAMITEHLAHLKGHIAEVCKRLGRNPTDITLIGVTKYAEADKIKEAIQAGLTDIGENKVQEAQRKFPLLQDSMPFKRHLIGHLQTNKVKQALQYFDLIHSVDSLRLAQVIDQEAAKVGRVADVLVQINTSGEAQKHGLHPSEAIRVMDEMSQLPCLRIQGVMTMAPFTEDKVVIRACFRDLKKFFEQAKASLKERERVSMRYLSMGMTDDYEIALEEGSNMIRIGRAIFRNE